MLKIISDYPDGVAPKDLIEAMGCNYGNLMDYLQALTGKGYLERVSDPTFRSKGLYRVPRRKGSKVRKSEEEGDGR